MAKLQCLGCGYKFESKREKIKRCPYCAREDTISREKSAEEVIDELEQIMKESG